jgi:hypothetical protein
MNCLEAMEKLRSIDHNKIFSVKFIKRTDGTERDMLCRRGVAKFVKGVEEDRAKKDQEVNCLTVFDVQEYQKLLTKPADQYTEDELQKIGSKCYRRIDLERLISFKVDGIVYDVNNFPIRLYTYRWENQVHSVNARTLEEADVIFKREMAVTRIGKDVSVTCDEKPITRR